MEPDGRAERANFEEKGLDAARAEPGGAGRGEATQVGRGSRAFRARDAGAGRLAGDRPPAGIDVPH